MQSCGSLLVVKDAQKAKDFYVNVLGVNVFNDLGDHVFFAEKFALIEEDTWLDLLAMHGGIVQYQHHAGEIVFEDDDLDAFLERLRQFPDVKILCPLRRYPWGQRVVRFYDPDEHIIEVGDSMKMVAKRFLKEGIPTIEVAEITMTPLSFAEACQTELDLEDNPFNSQESCK